MDNDENNFLDGLDYIDAMDESYGPTEQVLSGRSKMSFLEPVQTVPSSRAPGKKSGKKKK